MRWYRTDVGYWGIGIVKAPGGWHFCFGTWILTTEPPEST